MREIIADSRMMHIGKNGEGDALRVTFPVVGEWEALYGAGGVWTLNVQRNGDALAYAAQDFTIKDGAALWVVTDADAAVVGEGRCELTYKIGDTVAKSRTYSFRVDRSLTGGGDVPDPVKGWQEALEERVDGKLDRPDGGSAGDVLTKTEAGEEWQKPTGGKQLQADWNQNDRTAKDYIKNRPFYSQDETMVSSSYVDVLDSELNEMIEIPDNMNLIANIRWYKPFPFLEGSGKKMLYHIIIHISGQSSDIHNKASMSKKEDWSVIGGDNWKWDLGNTKNENFLLFFITDLSALDSAYTGMFPKTGIFLQRNNNWGYTYTKYTLNIGVTWLNMLDTNYIGSAIERTGNKVSEIVSGADAEQYPSVGAVEKYAVALQQAVADAGKVLTVGDDGKVVASGGGLSYSEKNLMLTLFKSIPYTSDVNATINSLSKIWNGTATYYSIEYNLTRITVDNEVYSIAEGGTLEIELDPDTATEITSITVTMSGIDVTSTAYANNKITINPVQGDIVITAVATSTAYTAIEYIQGDGTAWINTGYSPAAGDLVEMEFAATETNWDYVFSSYKRGSALYGFVTRMAYTIGTSTGFTRRMATDSSRQYNDRVMFTCVANTKYKLKETTAGTATLYNAAGEGLLTMVDEQASTFAEPTNPIFLLAQSNGDTPVGKIRAKEKIYKFTIIDAYGNKKLDLIPVLDSDGVACLYDKVSKKFIHDAAGGNTFIAGGQV